MEGTVLDPAGGAPGATSASVMHRMRGVWRRRWVMLGVALGVTALTAAWSLRQPRIYSASTSLIIDVTAPRILDGEVKEVMGEERSNYWFNKEYYATQSEIITSRAVATRVVDRLGLAKDADFLGLPANQDPAERAKALEDADAVGLLRSRIQVVPGKDSRVMNIGVEDTDPARAALLSNEVAAAYMAENLALKLRTTEEARTWLEGRLGELGRQSRSDEMAVYDLKKDADMLSTSLESRLSIVSERINSYNLKLTEVQTRIAAQQARVDAIHRLRKDAGNNDETWAEAVPGAKDGPIQDLKSRYGEQKAACAELSERYLPEHPKLLECNRKLEVVRADLLKSLTNVVRSAETQLVEAQGEEKNLNKLLDAAKAEAFQVNKKAIEYGRLQRESDNTQRLYELVLKRLKDIELSGLLRTSNVRVLDAAQPVTVPVRPHTRRNLMVGWVMGLLLGLGVALFLEMLENTVGSQADVEEVLGLAFLGVVPRMEATKAPGDRDLYVHRAPRSAVAECCRAVRTNLLFMSPDHPCKTLVVTSSGPQEGKSTTCINLGVAMAQSGNRVLLLDTDMRRPRLHRAFGVPNDLGISSLVVGEGSLDKAVKSTEVPNLFVLPCGPLPPNPAELLHTRAFKELLRQAGEKFDRIILDSPPLNAVVDAAVLATQADGVVMVLKAGRTDRGAAKRALRSLADVQARMFGAILNDVDLRQPRYGDTYLGYQGYGPTQDEPKGGVAPS
ncbi:polysaccharide biosynthesis tyrosine autokinase [Corallococcus sp. AB049A]|uniref:non-specific protein-tyrosine kinase n=1 Tax=Corallococcus interemptor TaxID=2316720 RepID=A0A3A8QW54_9BACT|nr:MULTISPECIES: polysaccharide biosynthesis tyrosine autokinase [Corallococcus]RKH70665.1 polysaccharide biosynthesis tyrosine autokinase [Corallococcus interemptor]RKI68927.1 polysaccharide biosynthesis tyrosine autokinase [Corallococcus sp. AB049A]